MAIELEDGTGKANAESFASVAEAQTYATARGLTLPAADADIEALLRKAAEFLNGIEGEFKGTRTLYSQRLPFPREGVYLFGTLLDGDVIPEQLKEAQIQLAIDANSTDLRPNGTTQEVIKKKVASLETVYAQSNSRNNQPTFNKALDLLKPLLRGGQLIVGRA